MMGVFVGLLMWATPSEIDTIEKDTLPSKSHLVLPEIHIKGNALVAKRRGDTLVFSADRFKRPDALRLEQLLSNLPGFQVDPNGNISFNGRPIKKLMLDGDDLTAENYQLISRNLRSLMVDSIQVIEKFNENRLLKNINGTNDIAVNLVLKQSFYGKPNTNITTAYAPKRNGEFQTELLALRRKRKQMIVVNANNIGGHSFQQDQVQQQNPGNKQLTMYASWPELLKNNLVSILDAKYINQNSDYGLSIASSLSINKYNQLRFNLHKSTLLETNTLSQHQFFSSVDGISIVLFSKQVQKHLLNTTHLQIHWEADKGDQKRTVIEFEGYKQKSEGLVNEVRQLNKTFDLNAQSGLNTNGFHFKIDHTRKMSTNHIWQWESILNGSTNNYQVDVNRNDVLQLDSIAYPFTQFVKHGGVNGQTSIGHIRSTKKHTIRYWLRTSITQLHSSENISNLKLSTFKTYQSTHLTRAVSRKINFDMQSMLGYVHMTYNRLATKASIYHIDQVFTWKPIATRQLSLNYGILKQEVEASRFFAGAIYTNAALQVAGPTTISLPVTLYSQLHFSLLDLYRGVNLYSQLIIREVKRDYFMSTTLYPYYTSIEQRRAERLSSVSFNFQLEKIIHPARLKYRLLFAAMRLESPAEFNSQLFTVGNTVTRIGQHISTNWRKGYNFQVEYQFVQSTFSGFGSNALQNSRHDYKVIVELLFSRCLNAHLTLQRYTSRNIMTFDLFDFKMNWTPNSKYRVYLTGNNLLNRKLFVQQIPGASSISTNQQYLIGRRVIVGLDFPL